jgi:outer membrane protein assembly factor BamB
MQGQRLNLPYQTESQQNEGSVSTWLWANISQSGTGGGATTWARLSTFDGHTLQTLTNVPKDVISVKFDDKSPIAWVVQANLNLWNTTVPMKLPYVNLIKWNFTKLESTVIYSNVYSNNWLDGIVWNVSAQTGNLVDIGDNNFRGPTVFPFVDANVVVVRTPNAMQIMAGFDYTTGARLWVNNATVLNLDVLIEGFATSPSGPLIMRDGASPNFVAYNVKTGQEIWRASTGQLPWSSIMAYSAVYNNRTHYFGSYDGHVYAYDTVTGKQVWQSDYVGTTDETMENNNPLNGHAVGADGVLYFSSVTTYNMMPRPRFQEMVAINQSTGHFLWQLPIAMMPVAVADGYLLTEDIDNGIQYALGKGQTTTTVNAPDTAVTLGTPIVIKGTVMDMSPGKPNKPAVSDTDMVTWMSYLYGQNATTLNNPPNVHGVPVTLSVMDSNGNYRTIGSTTTNSQGYYSLIWTPDITGPYTVFASFAGSGSYYQSQATNSFTVENTQATVTPQPIQTQSAADMYFVPAVAGIIVSIFIVGAILAILLLRKRP